jgi:hypothetical protein
MKTRILYPKNIWFDKGFKSLTTTSKVVSLYLVCNDNIGLTRYYKQHDLELCFLFKISESELEKIKSEIENTGLFFFKDEWVFINNDFSYCDYEGRDRLQIAKQKEIREIPQEISEYFEQVLKGLKTGYKPAINHKYKIINHKYKTINPKEVTKPSPTESQIVLDYYNQLTGKESKSLVWESNFYKWREVYSMDEIKQAVKLAHEVGWIWKDKEGKNIDWDLQLLFRHQDTQKNPQNYIDRILNRSKSNLVTRQGLKPNEWIAPSGKILIRNATKTMD